MVGALSRSLRVRVTMGVVLPLILILGVLTFIEYSRYRTTVLNNASVLASHSGEVIESSLQHAMLESDFDEVQSLLDTVGSLHEFQVVYLLDTSGHVMFAPDGEGVGQRLNNQEPACQPCHRLPADKRPRSIVVTAPSGERVFRSMHPIENDPACAQCHDPNERLLGLLLTDLSMAPLEEALRADLYEHLAWWVATVLMTVLVVNLVLSRFVLSRLEHLAVAVQRFGQDQRPPSALDAHRDEIGQLASAFSTMAHQVHARGEENQRLSEDLRQQSAVRGELLKRLITAQEDERQRIARELHDELGQGLTGLSLRVEALQRLVSSDPDRLDDQIPPIKALITETTDRMYNLILDLRPSALDDLGLVVAVSSYAERLLDGTGIVFHVHNELKSRRLPPAVETCLYRIFQEALTNVVRHAQAHRVEIALVERAGLLDASIEDDGCGFDPAVVKMNGTDHRGLGLLGIRERARQCGGQIDIVSQPGHYTRIEMRIPLEEGVCYE